MTDEQILELYFQRSEAAVQATIRKYEDYCFRIAWNILRSREDAQECVNDTWYAAWKSIPPARPVCFRLFLAKIVRNCALNRYQANRAKKRGGGQMEILLEELEECVPAKQDVESELLAGELRQLLEDFLKKQPQREAALFIRRYFYAEGLGEISERFGIRENHAAVLLARTRKKLKKYLEREGY